MGLRGSALLPALATLVSKEDWKERVAEEVERHEDRLREERAKCMTSMASKRYQQIKGWARVSEDAANFNGEIGRKGALVHEGYLDDHHEQVGRRLKMCCRAGCLPVMDRVGRMAGWAPQVRKCMLCDTGEVETVQHLILSCPAHQQHRDTMLEGVYKAYKGNIMTEDNADFGLQDPNSQCNILLGESTGIPRVDKHIDALFKRFIKKAWRNRKRVTSAVREILGCEDGLWALVK